MDVLTAIRDRRSVRAFLPTPVPDAVVRDILDTAARAPSGTNMQPWQAHVLTGAALTRVCDAVLAARETDASAHVPERSYYPNPFFEPYKTRRRTVGWGLYGKLGIAKDDKVRMWEQTGRNFTFFGAPVGIMFTVHRDLEIGSWLDYGMFLENVCLAARGHGLETCPQAAWAHFHKVLRAELSLDESEVVVCGMAIGHEDTEAVENTLETDREPLDGWATFHSA